MTRNSLCCLALLGLALPTEAHAVDFSFKLEPDVAIPLTSPQTDHYGVGAGESLKALFGVTPFLDIGPTASFHLLPANAPLAESGVVWGLGGGVRLKRSHAAESAAGLSPWLDADLFYMRTGALNRPGFDAAVGLAVPIGEARTFWLGPFARYSQVVQTPDRTDYDNHDARILSIGLSFEAGTGRKHPVTAAPVATQTAVVPATQVACQCVDTDTDGIPDTIDHCPEVVGPMDNWGCPAYQKIVVQKDKLELKEKLYFAWDEATLEDASFPVLDEVVRALKENKNFRVQVEGHTDSSGPDDHNQTLSERRAEAVLGYLVSHGIAKERLVSKGFASSVPVDTNTTAAGRENNRRVEFVVSFLILNAGIAK
jgi:outer membrane protein OmpA-like peptidoglycan-associated protein